MRAPMVVASMRAMMVVASMRAMMVMAASDGMPVRPHGPARHGIRSVAGSANFSEVPSSTSDPRRIDPITMVCYDVADLGAFDSSLGRLPPPRFWLVSFHVPIVWLQWAREASVGTRRKGQMHLWMAPSPQACSAGKGGCGRDVISWSGPGPTGPSFAHATCDRGRLPAALRRKMPLTAPPSSTGSASTLVVPVGGTNFGEVIEMTIYPAYVALQRMLSGSEAGKPGIDVVLTWGSGQRHVDNATARASAMYSARAPRPSTGMKELRRALRIARSTANVTRNATRFSITSAVPALLSRLPARASAADEKLHVHVAGDAPRTFDLRAMRERCPHPSRGGNPGGASTTSIIFNFVRSWRGVRSVTVRPAGAAPIAFSRASLVRTGVGRVWFDGGLHHSDHLHEMVRQMKMYYLVQPARPPPSDRTDGITIISRQCRYTSGLDWCTCKRVWLNEAEVVGAVRARYADRRVEQVEFTDLSLVAAMALMARTSVLLGIHGSAITNAIFLPHTSAAIEIWPRGYFESKNQAFVTMVGALYLSAVAADGNLVSHHAWLVTPLSQVMIGHPNHGGPSMDGFMQRVTVFPDRYIHSLTITHSIAGDAAG